MPALVRPETNRIELAGLIATDAGVNPSVYCEPVTAVSVPVPTAKPVRVAVAADVPAFATYT